MIVIMILNISFSRLCFHLSILIRAPSKHHQLTWRPVAGERLVGGTLSSGQQQLTVLVDVGKPSWDEDARMLQNDL